MTRIESIDEIWSYVLDIQNFLAGKKTVVYLRAYERYEKLVQRSSGNMSMGLSLIRKKPV